MTENMIRMMGRVCTAAIVAAGMAGCASTTAVSGGNGTIKIDAAPVPPMHAPGNAATLRVLPYVDARKVSDPRKVGVGGYNIYGVDAPRANDIRLSQDVATVVTATMARRMQDAGFKVVKDGKARFEISGTIRQLSYDIKARDQVSIVVETTLKDVESGKTLWSAVVSEKKERFAGIAGDDIRDVATFLRIELGVVTQKTAKAITGVLAALHPDMFHTIAGSTPVAGVKVLDTPETAAPATAQSSEKGILKITTRPARAEIYIGDVYYGLSPLRLELAPGILEVKAKLRHYKTAAEKVSVRQGQTTELEMTLKKLKPPKASP